MTIKLSRLLELRVEDEAGTRLGRVHDVRVRRVGDRYEVEGLIVGSRGLLVRLGWRAPHDVLPWEQVVSIQADRLVVRRRSQ